MAVIDFVIDASWQTASVPTAARGPAERLEPHDAVCARDAEDRERDGPRLDLRRGRGRTPAGARGGGPSRSRAWRGSYAVAGPGSSRRRGSRFVIGLSLLSRFSAFQRRRSARNRHVTDATRALDASPLPVTPIAEEIRLRLVDAWARSARVGRRSRIARVHAS